MKLRLNKRSGFTLIEIMLVVVIIGMLVTMVGMNLIKPRKQAYVVAAQSQINSYKMALGSYARDNDIFPTTAQGLEALIAPPNSEPVPLKWHGPYLDPPVIKPDPWGRPYVYICPAQQNPDPEGFDLYSKGPDGRENSEDDVVSWR